MVSYIFKDKFSGYITCTHIDITTDTNVMNLHRFIVYC